MKLFDDFLDIRAGLEVFKDCGDRHSGSAKDPGTAAPVGNALYGWALRPIKSCHIETLSLIVIPNPAPYQYRESAANAAFPIRSASPSASSAFGSCG